MRAEAMRTGFVLVLSLLALCAIASAQGKQTQEADIARFIESYDNAWNHKDAAAIERILAPDYVYFSSKGQVRSRQSLLEEFLSPKYNLASAERTELKAYLTMDTAVVYSAAGSRHGYLISPVPTMTSYWLPGVYPPSPRSCGIRSLRGTEHRNLWLQTTYRQNIPDKGLSVRSTLYLGTRPASYL